MNEKSCFELWIHLRRNQAKTMKITRPTNQLPKLKPDQSMDIPLSSSLNSAKLFLACPLAKNLLLRTNKFSIISCKACRKSGEKRGIIESYEVLSLDFNNSGVDEIKKAYRNMALRWHPDVCDPDRRAECTQMFMHVNKAYKTLLDQTLQEEYSWELGSRDKRGNDELSRERWESQLFELRRRSQKEGSWGSRMRAQLRHT
ncbi:unnamed protein product [Ilex paraguariensis]|uniref:J domain-containing protein n=1 Tax=Ilex paraguariensis TaxID=185542 RepID=A0ABC8TYU7_9AQUA